MLGRHTPAHLVSNAAPLNAMGTGEPASATLPKVTTERVYSARHGIAPAPADQPPTASTTRWVGLGAIAATALAGCAVVAAPALAATHWTTPKPVHTPRATAPVLAHDFFHRDVSQGFGAALVGGRYTLGYNGKVPFSVSRSQRGIVALHAGSASASLMSVDARDVDVASTIVIPSLRKMTHTLYTAVEARKQANRDAYRGKVVVARDGSLSVAISRHAGSSEVALAQRAIGLRVASNQRLHVELSVVGANPVELKVRTWTGSNQNRPTAWQLTVNDTSATALTGAGAVGMWDYVGADAAPALFHVNSLVARALPGNPRRPRPHPTPSPTPAPVTSSPAPVTSTPTPVTSTPAPTSSDPAPVSSTPVPSSSDPAPVSSTPVPTSSDPAPVSSTPAPVSSTTPAPVTSTPAPTSTMPTPVPPADPSRGSLPIGSASYPVPANALFVSPTGSDGSAGTLSAPKRTLGGALKAVQPGQTIVLRGGTYHETAFVPDALAGITIENYPGEAVWFDGSVPVTNWAQSGSTWVSSGWNTTFDHSASFTRGSDAGGFVLPTYPMAAWPDMVFADGAQLRQVATPADVVAGTFAVDYANHTLTIGSNPYGHELRASDLDHALTVSAMNVTVRGIGFRRYANSLPTGGALYFARNGDSVENVVIEDTATMAITAYKSNLRANHLTIARSGMLGINSYKADNSIVENSIITASNSEHFNKAPSSAGVKIVTSRNVVVRNNQISGGYDTHAIWTDGSVIGFTIVGNDLYGNGNSPVIQTEESAHGIIADNRISDGTMGAYIFDTSDVEVYNNTFANNSYGSVYISQDFRRAADYGMANPDCTWVVDNITIANNVFNLNGGPYGMQVYALDKSTGIPASAMGLKIMGNLFHQRTTSTDSMVAWGGSNATTTKYETPDALNAGTGNSWSNTQVAAAAVGSAVASTHGVGLPSDIASAVGQPLGLTTVGAFH
jgi:parallel beta-helix repeat protein